jgi:drug/metabolite transporter (DMT)-like permease
MNEAVLLGLLSAVSYGITDYVSRIAGRAAGVWRSLLYGDLLSFLLLSLWCLYGWCLHGRFLDAPGIETRDLGGHAGAWVAAVASGFILFAAAASLTQGLTRGTLAVVAPVTASYGAIAAVLSAAAGEHLSGRAIAGIAVTVTGVCMVSVPAHGLSELKAHLHRSGFGWALAAALCYGVGFWMQGTFAVPALGAFIPVWVSYLIVVATVPLLRRPLRLRLALPNRSQMPSVLGTGVFSGIAYVALTLGLATRRVAIVVVLSTLASAVTVLLSRFLDRAVIALHQWIAMVVIIGGLILIKT